MQDARAGQEPGQTSELGRREDVKGGAKQGYEREAASTFSIMSGVVPNGRGDSQGLLRLLPTWT